MNNSNREKLLKIIKEREEENAMQEHLKRMQSDQLSNSTKDYLTLVDEYIKENKGTSKAQTMRMVTRAHPNKHAEWIRQVNQG